MRIQARLCAAAQPRHATGSSCSSLDLAHVVAPQAAPISATDSHRSSHPMRSTKASAAVTRLNARDPAYRYSMGMTASGFFYLLRAEEGKSPERISGDLTMEEFVALANSTGPQKKVKISKFDQAFEKQLVKK
jgi:hypothetical protein